MRITLHIRSFTITITVKKSENRRCKTHEVNPQS